MMKTDNQPNRCPICQRTLTLEMQFAGLRCIDPGHWQAARLLTANDYYLMAQLMTWTAMGQTQAINKKRLALLRSSRFITSLAK